MKSFTKTTTETFTPRWVRPNYTTYDELFVRVRSRLREKFDRCLKCDKPFTLGDPMGLAAFGEAGNKVLCQTCAEELGGDACPT